MITSELDRVLGILTEHDIPGFDAAKVVSATDQLDEGDREKLGDQLGFILGHLTNVTEWRETLEKCREADAFSMNCLEGTIDTQRLKIGLLKARAELEAGR